MGVEPKDKPAFGGGNLTEFFSPDDPWEALHAIKNRLYAGEPLDPELAAWLHHAIKKSGRKPNELLRGLGLLKKRGRPASPIETWLPWAQRVMELEDEGEPTENALSIALQEMENTSQDGNRTTLQRWRDWYREARDIA